jgi:hypothetical protein
MAEGTPDLQELFRRAQDSRLRGVNVAMPGIVVSYDATKKTATVQPALRSTVPNDDGEFEAEDLQPIPNVKVIWPKCGKLSITGTLQAGDSVDLVFQTRATTEWRRTGKVATPLDERYHSIGYPVAFPGYDPDVADETDTDESIGRPGGLRLHFTDTAIKAGTGADFVAMNQKVAAQLSAIKTILATFAAACAAAAVEPALGPAATTLQTALGSWPLPAGVASSNLKADP